MFIKQEGIYSLFVLELNRVYGTDKCLNKKTEISEYSLVVLEWKNKSF